MFQFPTHEEEWKKLAEDFREKWQFDTCVGSIDGKHINIVKPHNSGSYYYNYKGKFSIVLLAIVNANYEFLMVHVGINGKISDGGVLQETTFYNKLLNGSLNLPAPKIIPSLAYSLPYTFIGDEAFPLMENLLKPYPQKSLRKDERIFNYRLCRARRVVENAFGILASRFRVFTTDIGLSVKNIDYVVLAACVLHNYLRRNATNAYSPNSFIDREDLHLGDIVEGEWRLNSVKLTPLQRTPRAASSAAKCIRDQYKTYFNTEGSVPFQEGMAFRGRSGQFSLNTQ